MKTTKKTTKKTVKKTPAKAEPTIRDADAIYADVTGATDLGTLADVPPTVSCPVYIVARPDQADALRPDSIRPIIHGQREAVLCLWHVSELANDPSVDDLKARLTSTYQTIGRP